MVENFKQTEIGAIPHDWDIKNIVEFSTMKARIGWQGLTVSEYLDRGDYFLITGTDLVDGRIKWDTCHFVNKDRFTQDKNIQIKAGDILITKDGTIGKVAYVDSMTMPATLNSGVFVIRPKKEAYLPIFLFYIFNSSYFRDFLNKLVAGSTISHLYQKDFITFNFPLPKTVTEQTAIATALNDADALITQLEKLIAKKKAMKQGAVQELFKPQKGWQTKSLGDIANIRRGASPRPIKDPKWFSQKGRGWIRISDVTSSNVYLNSTTQYLSEEGVKYSVPVDKGDLIMSICATIGVPVIINIPACIHDGFVLFSNYENNLDTFYLYFFLQKETDALVGKGQPGTQKNLNISIVSNIEISYPSVEEQKKIGLILKDIDIELSGLEQRLEKQKQLKQGMMQSLLTGKIRLV